jgi:hypothetical protein
MFVIIHIAFVSSRRVNPRVLWLMEMRSIVRLEPQQAEFSWPTHQK